MQRITTLLFVLLLSSGWLSAQINDGSLPLTSYTTQRLSNNIPTVQAPALNRAQIAYQDSIDNISGGIPKIGQIRPVQINLNNKGTWENLPNGDRLWRVRILASGAKALNLYFDDFYLPQGAKLHVYDDGRNQIIGGFTSRNNSGNGYFATELIFGEALVVEYYEPAAVQGQGRLNIAEIGHVHRNARNYTNPNVPSQRNFGASDPCQVNVNCTEGVGKEPQRDATARILVRVGANQGWCSGSLVNNVRQDCTPYFLTALHCGVDASNNVTTAADFNQWVFYFKFQGPGCSNPPVQGSLATNTMTGCVLRAESNDGGGNTGSDMLLVEFNNSVPSSYDPYYAGWNANNAAATGGYGIHHPAGDIKKISTYTGTLTSTSWGGTVPNTHWQVTWVSTINGHGVTEGGSSGSAIFNNTGQIVGTLTGGSSFCANTSAPDSYGKMSYHWGSNGTTAATRLRDWLDPDNTGTLTLPGTYSPCSAVADDAGITAFNNPTDGSTYCSDSIAPEVVITNIGSNTLTSATINYQIGAGSLNTFSWTGNLTTGATDNVTLPLTAVPTTGAAVNFTAYTTLPNGSVDTVNFNDTTIISASYELSNPLPYAEAFDAGTLPADISTINPDGDGFEWVYSTAASGYATGTGSMFYDNYNGSTANNPGGTDDYFLLPTLDLSSASSASMTFDVAYARYVSGGGGTFNADSLIVAVVRGCDGPTNIAFQEGGATLETNGASNSAYTPSTTADWATKTVDLTPYVGESHVQIYFVNRSGWGNNLYIDNINITAPCNLSASANASDASCNGVCDGSATVTPSNGAAPFTYAWGNGQTTATATGLCAGTYSVTITDAASCTATATATVSEPAALTINGSSTNESPLGNDGTATGTVGGGTTPYSYLWSDGQNTATATGLTAGTYNVTATDANSCTISSSVVVNATPCVLVLTTTATNANCAGACDGTATAAASGGSMPYSYAWSNGQTTSTATGLCAGAYSVTVIDAIGCTATATATISEPTALTASTSSTDESPAGNDGTATIGVAGGTPTYTYLWSNGQTAATAAGLAGGTYTVTISDANACSLIDSVTVNTITCNNLALNSSAVDATCNGGCDGNATAAPTGGIAPYNYSWSNGQTTASITGLCAGTYTLTVTDSVGCVATDTLSINEPLLVVPNTTTTATTCAGGNGAATVSPSGGTAPYAYAWPNGQTTATATGLNAQTYSLTITDAASCVSLHNVVVPNGCFCNVQANITTTPTSCFNSCDGGAYITVTSGLAPYSYAWQNGATTDTITALCNGAYSVTVTDANNCTAVFSTVIASPSAINSNVTSSAETCAGNNGAANVFAAGGALGYSYTWSNGATGSSITGLSQGSYDVTITDQNGCTATNTAVVPLNNSGLSNNVGNAAVLSDVSCNGGTDGSATINVTNFPNASYTWSNGETQDTAIALTAGVNYVTVSTPVGCAVIDSVTVNEPAPLGVNTVVNTTDCIGNSGQIAAFANGGTGPYSFSWSNGASFGFIDSLVSGTYGATITDANACTFTFSSTIPTIPVGPQVTTAVTTAPLCSYSNDGSIDIDVTPAGNYLFSWSNGATTEDLTNASGGIHTVIVTDTSIGGCFTTYTDTLRAPTPLAININRTPASSPTASDGLISATVSGGTWPYNFFWNTGAVDSVLTGMSVGNYSLVLIDANGCSDSTSFQLGATTALGDVSAVRSFELLPNPNSGQFQVNLELTQIGEVDLQVLDMLGRVLHEQYLEGDVFNLPMDFSSLPAGTYIMMIQTEKGRVAKRVVIRR